MSTVVKTNFKRHLPNENPCCMYASKIDHIIFNAIISLLVTCFCYVYETMKLDGLKL